MLILLFVLMFFGSKSIPGIARTLGQTMRQIKDASQDLQNEIKKSGMDIKNDLNMNRMLEETVEEIERPFYEQTREMNEAVRFEAPRSFEIPENVLEAKTPPATFKQPEMIETTEPVAQEEPATDPPAEKVQADPKA